MEKLTKTDLEKVSFDTNKKEIYPPNSKNKAVNNKYIIQHFMHPNYILFDWEFFSNELEFE
jgi:hypothetical protein